MKLLNRLFGRLTEADVVRWAQSQHGEDRYVLNILTGRSERFVVDVGANDGKAWSNSYLFGKLGYRLVLVEPMPRYAQMCRALWDGNRKVTVEEAAVSTTAGEASFFLNLDAETDLLAMRSSLGKANVPGGRVEEIKVRVERLDTILERAGCPRDYAFLSVDAEGFDLEVLQSAGLDRFRPEIICVEDEVDFSGAIRRSLADLGFDPLMRLGPNGLYRRRETSRKRLYHYSGGLWIDRIDAAKEIARRTQAGVLSPEVSADLTPFERQGYVVLPKAADEALLQAYVAGTDKLDPHACSPAALDLLSHPRLTGLLSAIFEGEPLLFASRPNPAGDDEHLLASQDTVVEPYKQVSCFIALTDGLAIASQNHRASFPQSKSIQLRRGDMVLWHANHTHVLEPEGLVGLFCPLGVAPTYFFAREDRRGAARHLGLAYSSAHFPV